jgi:hypothetical protein
MTAMPKSVQKAPRKFNTLQILRGGWYATWGISLLLLVVSIQGVHSQRDALKTVGTDAAPSVLTAQELQDSFADMDASLANELLLQPGDNRQQAALADFKINHEKIAERLVAAAKNITYSGEQDLIQNIQFDSISYLLKLQEARDAHQRKEVGTLNIYLDAAKLMDDKIIKNAERLSKLNSDELSKKYAQQRFNNGGISLLIAIVGITQIALLVMVQIFLYRRMRRIVNLPLLIATAIAIIFLGYTLISLVGAAAHLRTAKDDAFESLYALRQMRSLSYKANGDESRYLLDRANAPKHEQSFHHKIDKIINLPANQSISNIIANVNQKKSMSGVTGLLADELNNITFPGEKELAIETLIKFNQYVDIDKQIRQLYNSGKLTEAIALCVGTAANQSNGAFNQYKDLQKKLINLNKDEFKKNIDSGNYRLKNFEIVATTALLTIAILTLLGLRPRLLEYL